MVEAGRLRDAKPLHDRKARAVDEREILVAMGRADPLPTWRDRRVVLLGDACHPMTPYMAQGAASALEDAAVLARCLAAVRSDGIDAALARYEATRKPRTSDIQGASSQNTWMRYATDPGWVYGYDAWTEPLAGQGG